MTNASALTFTYREFSDFVRRFNQEAMLFAVARRALSLPGHLDGSPEARAYVATPPWALAAVAKAAICNGNAHRRAVPTERDVVTACGMHNNLAKHELRDPELNSPFAVLARIAFEQFPYQESMMEEIARSMSFFDDYSGGKALEVVTAESMRELVGADMTTAAGIVILLVAAADHNSGVFDPAWMDQPSFARILSSLPRDEIVAVIESAFVTGMKEFRHEDEAARRRVPLAHLDRYAFNPLTSRPFVRLSDGRLLAPVPRLIPRRMSPLELYYLGLGRWREAFARDMGELLEDYVGRQFATLPDVTVFPEIAYREGRDNLKSIDKFLVFHDLVVLIEAKAGRSPLAARAADASAQEQYQRTLGKAFKQLDRTLGKVRDRAPEFAHIPDGRPIVGMVATLDPWYIANSFGRDFLPSPGLPTIVASVRDIEHLVAVGQRRSVAAVLHEITRTGDERQTWELGVALNDFRDPADRNPLLTEVWERLPFSETQQG
ncbi:hypothetical protein [Actinoplanes sp. NBRC 103695]|uniref:hypothetical protein n=1 Tax=Actinoplanes sp. NBRC 103695 TaxID=3032202 RepID=UPI0024A5324E|nr:hypothetical protein [Actinoplanes sp. NBRC 103695]GLY99853.1 hypothetical protein Acsp02_71060 [Actinoplanes sp. NBRC 103695]